MLVVPVILLIASYFILESISVWIFNYTVILIITDIKDNTNEEKEKGLKAKQVKPLVNLIPLKLATSSAFLIPFRYPSFKIFLVSPLPNSHNNL